MSVCCISKQLSVAESRRQQTQKSNNHNTVTRCCNVRMWRVTETQRMLVTRSVRGTGRALVRGARSLWTGRESLESDDPEMWSLVQQEKRRQVRNSLMWIIMNIIMKTVLNLLRKPVRWSMFCCLFTVTSQPSHVPGVRAGADSQWELLQPGRADSAGLLS